MVFKVYVTQSTQDDLEEIWSYIAKDSASQAAGFISELEKHISTLEQQPKRGAIVSELVIEGQPYRQLLHGKYRIIYRIVVKDVYVVRILHCARLLDFSILD